MKILHVNSYYYGSKFYKNLYDRQVENGLNIDVYVPVSSAENLVEFKLGDYTTFSATYQKYDRLFFHLKHNKILRDIVEKYNISEFSLMHAHSLFSNGYVSMKLSQKYNLPYIVAVRDTDVNLFFRKMPHLRKLGIDILKRAKKIVFLSKGYKEEVIENYVPNKLKESIYKKTAIIPNGIDNYWFDNIGVEKKTPSNFELKLLCVGVINKRKNISTTIKAIEILQKKGYNIKFTAVGKIEDNEIFSEIKDLPYLNYISQQSREGLKDIYQKNDIFVLPSITETFGLVYPEAMSQGLPIIYSKGQGFDRQFENGEVGYTVCSTSATDIANEIQNVLVNYDKLSRNCIEKVNNFRWDSIEEQYTALYLKLIK
ncbi:glycosyltransferase family 4 protein [Oceanobacillus profundus]|uniref:glycosyltransferase family 4 protein n=1 Tax=Oceanobacillus profundus TaxID=372463 RepID=UPI00203C7F75|nr:glycosyltransferase family 4 protein [Oceanobacillus profundus]MCM3399458.1 glycosyltransferase family 4 protein [Oceanobacillus profundus]